MSFVTHYMFLQLNAPKTDPSMHKQMTGKAGVKLFGKKAIEALVEEMVQFFDLEVFEGIILEALIKE